MKIETNLLQGTPAWHEYRRNHFNASDAAAMLGISPYKTREELLKEYATGITSEIDASTQTRFDEGHRIEPLARSIVEKMQGFDLYPVVGSVGKLSASFDGLTLDGSVVYEHKTLSNAYRGAKTQSDLPEYLLAQIEQQLHISCAEWAIFHATKWNENNLVEEVQIAVFPDLRLRQKIIDGWQQFERDLAKYVPVEIADKPLAKSVIELPALVLQAEGRLVNSNMSAFGEALKAHLSDARSLVYTTDQEFADAESRAKLYRETCKKLELAKDQMLAQTVSIDEAFRLIDTWHEDLRTTALQIEKDCKANKESKQIAMINAGKIEFTAYVSELEKFIAPVRLNYTMPNFADAIKGKRLFTAMHDAIQTALANAKIEHKRIADSVFSNIEFLDRHHEYKALFADLQTIAYKPADDFVLLVTSRINAHKKAEQAKIDAATQAAAAKAIEEERARVESVRVIAEQKAKADAEAAELFEKQQQAMIEAKLQDDAAEKLFVPDEPVLSPQIRMVKTVSAPVTSTPPTLRLGQIGERLGFNLTADFLKSLGFEHSAKDKAALLFHENQFNEICAALIKHIGAAMQSKAA